MSPKQEIYRKDKYSAVCDACGCRIGSGFTHDDVTTHRGKVLCSSCTKAWKIQPDSSWQEFLHGKGVKHDTSKDRVAATKRSAPNKTGADSGFSWGGEIDSLPQRIK